MKHDHEFLAGQIRRLSARRRYPHEDKQKEAWTDLFDALAKAQSEPHARDCIDHFALYGDECPTPAQIQNQLWNTRKEKPEPAPVVDSWGRCKCSGSGLVGEPPDMRYCECSAAESLKRDIPTWDRVIYGEGPREDGTGPKVIETRKWRVEEYLRFFNRKGGAAGEIVRSKYPPEDMLQRRRDIDAALTAPRDRKEDPTTAEVLATLEAYSKGSRTTEETKAIEDQIYRLYPHLKGAR